MLNVEVIEFCEDNAIKVSKFLNDNFERQQENNKSKKRRRIKHSEISSFQNIVPVSLFFAYRYKELVYTGKLVIVVDDYGKYAVYVNPRIIASATMFETLQKLLGENDSNVQISEEIKDILENIRIIRHFKGEESIEYSQRSFKTLSRIRMKDKKTS